MVTTISLAVCWSRSAMLLMVLSKEITAMAKCAFAAGIKYSGLLKSRERVLQTSFQVDPREELGYVELGAPQGA